MHYRALQDASRLGLVLKPNAVQPPSGQDEVALLNQTLGQSKVERSARMCAEWAITGRGDPGEVAAALRELRADLSSVEVGDVPWRALDLTTTPGVLVVAAAARLALTEGRTVEVVEVATLASVDERTIRAAVEAGELRPVGPGRPVRFAAEVVRAYLYARGVLGFSAPEETETSQTLST